MNREEAPGKSPEDMYIQQKVRVLLMLKKMGSNVSTFSKHNTNYVHVIFQCGVCTFLKFKFLCCLLHILIHTMFFC